MASRSWNRIELIGNLTRDVELRYTPSGIAVATIGLATNRTYVTDGEKKEEVDFHKIIAWGKLGELCSQLIKKGNRVFMSGRLQYREWETQDGQKRRDAEIVLEDMILLTSRGYEESGLSRTTELVNEDAILEEPKSKTEQVDEVIKEEAKEDDKKDEKEKKSDEKSKNPPENEIVADEDLPF